MTKRDSLDLFGKQLMIEVRDRAIERVSMILDGTLKSDEAQVLHRQLRPLAKNNEILIRFAEMAIDTTLHDLLVLFDESKDIQVSVVDGVNSIVLRDASDGLAGELYGAKGWLANFSKA